jgi:curved DNA-binding protein CbpA
VLKDYYKILEISPSATYAEIKKSYRKLALQYHPDKNFGNQFFEAKFKEIKEAYEILSDQKQRHEYNFKRNGKYYSEKKNTVKPTSPQTILNETMDFRKKINVLDPDRMNKLALFQQIQRLLSDSNVSVLQQCNDAKINKRIIEEILYCSRFLPFPHVEKICFQLTALAGTDNLLYRKIYDFSKQVRIRNYWNRYKVFVALIIALILCFAIYILSANT